MLRVYSGKCCLCDSGIEVVGAKDRWGSDLELHTGDIVILWNVGYPDTDLEVHTCNGMTVIVKNQYTTYNDGTIVENEDSGVPFCMGIKSVSWDDSEWRIDIVKKWYNVVDGEHWPDYGFNFKNS